MNCICGGNRRITFSWEILNLKHVQYCGFLFFFSPYTYENKIVDGEQMNKNRQADGENVRAIEVPVSAVKFYMFRCFDKVNNIGAHFLRFSQFIFENSG